MRDALSPSMRRGALALCLLMLTAAGARAQGYVIQGSSWAQFLDMRPLRTDSVPFAATDSMSNLLRRTPNGSVTTCATGDAYCYYYASAPQAHLTALMQDLDVTAWGLGTGLSVHAQLRARTAAGDHRDLWPQADQTFDVLAAYLEYDRSPVLARLGRQWTTGGLGVFNFDGASISVHPISEIGINVYGGGTLIQGLDRPLDAAELTPVEDIPPLDKSFLVGGSVQIRPSANGAMTLQYQRQMPNDRSTLYAERVAANASWRFGGLTVNGEATRNLATETFNDLVAHFALDPWHDFTPQVEFRRYVPYFDLWTIWGAFSPVGYDETTGSLNWTAPGARLGLGVSGGYRKYDDTYSGVAFLPLRSSGWHVGATGSLRATDTWSVQGGYNMDINFGASSSDGDVAIRWSPGDRGSLALHGTAFQNLYEFTVGEGRVLGGGLQGTYQLHPDLRFIGDATVYRHTGRNDPGMVDWNQLRASVRLEWRVGGEPAPWTVGPVRKP